MWKRESHTVLLKTKKVFSWAPLYNIYSFHFIVSPVEYIGYDGRCGCESSSSTSVGDVLSWSDLGVALFFTFLRVCKVYVDTDCYSIIRAAGSFSWTLGIPWCRGSMITSPVTYTSPISSQVTWRPTKGNLEGPSF